MAEADKKVRKQWLALLGVSIFFSFLNVFIGIQYNHAFDQFPIIKYTQAVFSFLFFLLFAWIFYRCAYRKPGTKLLSISLVLSAASFIINPVLYFKGMIQTNFPYQFALFALGQVFGILWVITCWRLRKVNKKLQAAARSA